MSNLRPTFHESWYRVADLRARLRPSAQISRQYYRGERWYVVRDPAGNQYHRLSSAAYRFVGLLDGSRTVAEAWDLAGGIMADDAPTQPEVVQILSQLHAANLLEANITADAGVLLRRHKQMMKRRLQGRLMNVLFPRIPLWDLDSFLVRWLPVMRTVLSKFGILLWLGVVIAAVAMIIPDWHKLKEDASSAISPGNWPWLWATFVIIKLIHELGHAFTCRRFGGEVHELGVMFLVFVPAPYVDASSAWSLPSKWQRTLVGAGGMIFELFVAAICAFVWKYTAPGLVHSLAYNTMLIASVSTVIFNANPLLRYDGYYMLSDLLEIPNLKQKSMEYSMGLIKRHVFRVKSPIPLPPPGQRFWLFLYAVTSGAYRVFVGVMIILVVSNQVPVLGILMALGGVVTWLVVPVVKVSNYILLDPELHRKRGRAVAFTVVVAGMIAVLIGVIKFPERFEAVGIVKAENEYTLRAITPGFVEQVLVKDGQAVLAGQVMVVCRDREMEAEILKTQAQARASEARMKQSLVSSPADYQVEKANLDGIKKQLAILVKQRDDMTVRAPFDGVVVAPMIHELQDRYIKRGEDIATVVKADWLLIRAVVPQTDAALLFMNRNLWSPVKDLPGGWDATPSDVKHMLDAAGAKYVETPAAEVRQPGEPIQRVAAASSQAMFGRPGKVEFVFDYGQLSSIAATFEAVGPVKSDAKAAFDEIAAENIKEFGKADEKAAAPPIAGARRAHWLAERDQAALDISLSEQSGKTTVVYQAMGRLVEVRMATARSTNLTARVLMRVPAGTTTLPHASLTFAGGGEHQNDPHDQTGTKVTTPEFEVVLRMENPNMAYLPGQRAYVRFTMEHDQPLLYQWGRKFWQLLQTQNAQNKWL